MSPVAQASHSACTALLSRLAATVEDYMVRCLDERPLPTNLREAARYALLGGGKRLRPALVMLCCQAVGGRTEDALPPAAAIEMVHAFSLVHDDLPAMDDDDLRRGRPTLHKHTSEAMAILAGDLLLGLALEILSEKPTDQSLARRLTVELSGATNDMIAGQVYDTLPDFDPGTPALERLQTIHRHKTGALIRGACRMGAIAGGASPAQLQALSRYGEAIGLMFQVVDDLLDVTQSTEHLGKKAAKDAGRGKLTYPGVIGVEASGAEVTRLRDEAIAALADLGDSAGPLRDLCDYMAVRTR